MFLMFSEILTAGNDRFCLKMLTFVQFLDLVMKIFQFAFLPLPLAGKISLPNRRISQKSTFSKKRAGAAVKISENIKNINNDDLESFPGTLGVSAGEA